MLLDVSIRFPNLGIELNNVGNGYNIFGFHIAYYGIVITLGIVLGFLVAEWQAGRTGQDKELYLDFLLSTIIFSVVGARLYYVIFSWNDYKDNLLSILNLRGGGLAIYGGIIAGTITAYVFCRVKKYSFWLLGDTAVAGLLTGQIIGRWGNFFNREAFGGYTDGLFAMQLKKSEVYISNITDEMLANIKTIGGAEYIQVHPTFLYESLWNLMLLILILFYTKHKKFDGELTLFYLIGYGIGRTWIEGLRTDQLLVWGTGLAVSQLFSIILVIISTLFLLYKYSRLKKQKK